MTRRTGEDVLTRGEADRRIRGTARVASVLCWVAATLALALAAWSLFVAAWVTWSSAQASGTDLATAFLTTSEASGDFVLCAAGLLLVAVARMFEYGCILQKQDDELL